MSRCGRHSLSVLVCSLLLLCSASPLPASGGPPPRSSLKTVEGEVLDVGSVVAEGEIGVVTVRIAPDGDREHPLTVLLAPAGAMQTIGFSVEKGDRLKVKYFVDEEGAGKAHKVLNSTRGLMVRLRTLRQIPLWNNQGQWQGGPGRMRHGQSPGRGGP